MCLTLSDTKPPLPYDRLPGEAKRDKPWQAFCLYRDMGESRTLKKVANQLGKSLPLMERWSREFHWIERVRAFDNDQEIRRRNRELERRDAEYEQKLQQYREVLEKSSMKAFAGINKGLIKLSAKLDNLDPEEIPTRQLFASIKALTDSITKAGEAWATALGVEDVARGLDEIKAKNSEKLTEE